MIYSFSLHRKFQKPFNLSQLRLSRNYSEEEIYRQLNSICEILEYINTLNGLHTNYEHKYNGSRLTEVAALIAAGAQVQKDVCSWVSQFYSITFYIVTVNMNVYSYCTV